MLIDQTNRINAYRSQEHSWDVNDDDDDDVKRNQSIQCICIKYINHSLIVRLCTCLKDGNFCGRKLKNVVNS